MTVQFDDVVKVFCEAGKKCVNSATEYVKEHPVGAAVIGNLLLGDPAGLVPTAAAVGDTFLSTTAVAGGAVAGVDAATGHVASGTIAAATTPGVPETVATGVGIQAAVKAIEE